MEKNYEERASCSWSEDSIRLIITPSATAKSTYFYVQECGDFKTDETYFTERKNLNSFLILYTISGEGILNYEGSAYTLDAGSCFLINCMNYSYYAAKKNAKKRKSWDFLWLHFNGNSALGYYNEFIRNSSPVLKIQDNFFMESTLRRIISINKKRNISTEVLSSSLITNILTELIIQTSTLNAPVLYTPEYLKSILKYLDQYFTSEISLDYLSETYGISKFHLSKEFKKYTGTTIHEYIITQRISYAKELLKYSEKSINEIAYLTGINYVSHFINLFKSRENVTPLQYRKAWRD